MIHTILWAIYFILYLIIVSPMRAYYAHQIKKGNREKVQAGVDRMVHNWAPDYAPIHGLSSLLS